VCTVLRSNCWANNPTVFFNGPLQSRSLTTEGGSTHGIAIVPIAFCSEGTDWMGASVLLILGPMMCQPMPALPEGPSLSRFGSEFDS
jgi:hypothetical protein